MKRSAIQRRSPLKAKSPSTATVPVLRKKKCAHCRETFTPTRPMQRACGWNCAIAVGQADKAKAERKQDKVRKEKLKRRADWLKDAQIAFNAWVRYRDRNQPCICCGKPFEPEKPGGAVDAGHYLSRGSAPHLRFDERNVFAQRKNCNRPGGTTREAFRAGVVARIGLEAVEALEADQGVAKWTVEELKAIRDLYRAKLKELKAAA